jgi:hypothetical protein
MKSGSPRRKVESDFLGAEHRVPFEDQLDGWIKRQSEKPSRPEAIHRLVEMALSGSDPTNQSATFSEGHGLDEATTALVPATAIGA